MSTRHEGVQEPNETPNISDSVIELSSEFARRIFTYLGRPIPGSSSVLYKLILLLHISVILQIILVLIYNWDDFSVRAKAIEQLNLGYLSVITFVDLTFYPHKIETFMNTINGPIFEYKFKLSDEQTQLKKCVILEDESIKKRFTGVIMYYYLGVHFLPSVISILQMVIATDDNCCDEAFSPYVFWLPFRLTNVSIYGLLLFIQNLCSVTMCVTYTSYFVLFNCSVLHIGKEIDVLCLFINEMDNRLKLNIAAHPTEINSGDDIKMFNKLEENLIKSYMKSMVQHHQAIIQAVKNINGSSSMMMLMYNQFCCMELCINLYLAFVITDARRYNYFSTFFIVMFLVGLIGNTGQKLIDKGEHLNQAINECNWINKPQWFKKSIYIMTIFALKPLQIKPGNISVLNLANTTKIGRAAYSYFNVLRSFKDQN